jgi:hypothetical protein
VAYIFQLGDPGYIENQQHGLIAAASDQGTGAPWSPYANISVPSAHGTAIGTGLANTNAILAQTGAGTCVASLARAYTGGGYSDWYLPSRDELYKLYVNRDKIGGFVPGEYNISWYWSSSWSLTQYGNGHAWTVNFGTNGGGDMTEPDVTEWWSVRAVRSFWPTTCSPVRRGGAVEYAHAPPENHLRPSPMIRRCTDTSDAPVQRTGSGPQRRGAPRVRRGLALAWWTATGAVD